MSEPVFERVYKTGDIGQIRHDGLIEFKGRKDAQVKVRGYRIELNEIDQNLSDDNYSDFDFDGTCE